MPNEKPSFLIQLQQRHVFRVAAMYAVTSWLLLQLGSVTFEPLGFPEWSQRALIVLVAAGFPVALVLAWIFDVTPQGAVSTDAGSPTGLSRGRKLDIVIIVVLLAALVVTVAWRREPASVSAVAQESSIVVLPFVAMSEDASLRHLGEGLSEQITNELAQRSDLRVASRTSASEKHAGQNAIAIAQTLRVSYVLEGSVRPSGDKVRVTAQLVRGQDGLHVWSNTYDVAEADAAVWDQTAATVSVIAGSYMALERSLQRARASTTNAKAYEDYEAAARLRWQLTTEGTTTPKPWEQILDGVDRAIALDPNFVSAHRLRANVFGNKLDRGAACGSTCINEARRSIHRALALKPDDPDALIQLGHLQLNDDLDPVAAEATLERVRQVDPTHRLLNESSAFLAMFRGNAHDARDSWVRQLEVTPHVAVQHVWYSSVLLGIGDFDGAEREAQSALRLTLRGDALGIASLHLRLLIQRGEIDRAKAEFAPLWADFRYTRPEQLLSVLPGLGYEAEARERVAKLGQQSDADPFWMFLAYYGLGMNDDALVWLRRAVDGRDLRVVYLLRLSNQWPGLQQQPGYAELLKYLDSIQRSR